MFNKNYYISVSNTSDETILGLLELGTVEIISENVVKLRAKIGIKDKIEKCQNVIKVIK